MGSHRRDPKRVYFIRRADGTGPIKIGCSAWPEARVKQISTDLKAKVITLASAPGDYRDEGRLHRQFAALRIEGEWFTAAPQLLAAVDYVARHGKLPPTPVSDRDVVIAGRYLNGETLQQIANDFGITRERVRQLLRAQGVPSLGLREHHKLKPDHTEEECARIVAAYSAGTHPKEIVKAFALKGYYVLRLILERHGIERLGPGFWNTRDDDAEITAEVVALYQAGLTGNEIVARVPQLKFQSHVYRYLKKAGVPPRTNKGRRRNHHAAPQQAAA